MATSLDRNLTTAQKRSSTTRHWLVALILHLACTGAVADAAPFAWPNGARAAVSLAYDDALDSQLDHALPALNRHGLKASFYLTLSGPTVQKRMPAWRAAAAHGHELGNHTLFHQCAKTGPERAWVSDENDLLTTSAARLAAQIRLANTMLQAIDGQHERTFTTPCGDLMAGGVNYIGLIKDEFVAIKSSGTAVTPAMSGLDRYAVGVAAPVDMSGKQLIDLVIEAGRRGTMLNLTFHGVGGDYLSVSRQAHDELLAYLAAHRKLYWTDTFINIMRHVQRQRRAGPGPVEP